MILPGANNGMQLVRSIVGNFNGIVTFNYSNICVNFILKSVSHTLIMLKSVSHTSKNSPESIIA